MFFEKCSYSGRKRGQGYLIGHATKYFLYAALNTHYFRYLGAVRFDRFFEVNINWKFGFKTAHIEAKREVAVIE